jgi:putative MATE family efflux protein
MSESEPPTDPPEPSSQGTITRKLLDLAWPIIGVNVLAVLALAVDTAMVGRAPNAQSGLVGLGYATQVVFLLMVIMIGLTVGTVAFVARAHGTGHDERVQHIMHQSIQLTVLLGVVIAVVGNVLAHPILTLLGADEGSIESGLAYLRPLLMGTAFAYLNILYGAVLRGVGNTRVAFYVALLMNVLNVVFNYGLILGNFGLPELGIQGAAIGTVAAQFCAAGLMHSILHRGAVRGVRPVIAYEPIDRPLARDLIRIGWPASMDMLILNAGFLTIIGLLGRLDEVAVAAHGIGLRVQALAFVPGMSISQATGALVGAALGAAHVEEARRVVRASVVVSTAVMSSLAAVLLFFAGPIVELFEIAPGSTLFDYSVMWMKILAWAMPVVGIYISFGGMLQGAGATRTSLRINTWSTLGLQIPLSYLLGITFGLGVWGVWVAFPLSFGLKMFWGLYEYKRERWAVLGERV